MANAFRFHSPTNIAPNNSVHRLKKRRRKPSNKPTLLAADHASLKDAHGQWPLEAYTNFPKTSYVTLTRFEADLIALANPGVKPPDALERLYPWLPKKAYRENSAQNFEAASTIVKKYEQHFVTASAYCDEKWNSVCNSVRLKTDIDARFFSAWHLPVQDCYVLEENRPDRCVLAVDFNAMYPSCMQQVFPKPSKLRHVIYNRDIASDENLPMGLYRCRLDGPTSDFIKNYNPFRTFFAGRHLRPALDESLWIDLNEFEIEFYRRHFKRIFVDDAVVSEKSIPHPLAREARRLFARRSHFKANKNKPLADREKFLSTLLTSCTHRPNRLDYTFETPALAEEFLRNDFGIDTDADDPAGLSSVWLHGRKGFTVNEAHDGVRCTTPDVKSKFACFMFNQRIVARSRVTVLEMMVRLLESAPNVELCYANVDSIHFSFPEKYLSSVMNGLSSSISDKMGHYKIETIARGGLWLEPGRYWLYSDKIDKFKNRSISHNGQAFKDHTVRVTTRLIGDLYIPIRSGVCFDRSMSDSRSIQYDPMTGLERQRLLEIRSGGSSTDVIRKLSRNRKLDIPRRLQAFRNLALSFGSVEARCLETQHTCQNSISRRGDPR